MNPILVLSSPFEGLTAGGEERERPTHVIEDKRDVGSMAEINMYAFMNPLGKE